MTVFRPGLAALMVAMLCACAASNVVDGERLDPKLAYVVVSPHFGTGSGRAVGFITRVGDDRSTERMKFDVLNGHVQVLAVPPGHYYVDTVSPGNFDFRFVPVQSAFEAAAGQLNYPGDWYFAAAVQGDFTPSLHNKYYQYRSSLIVRDELDQLLLNLSSDYPQTSKMGTPVYTRIVFH